MHARGPADVPERVETIRSAQPVPFSVRRRSAARRRGHLPGHHGDHRSTGRVVAIPFWTGEAGDGSVRGGSRRWGDAVARWLGARSRRGHTKRSLRTSVILLTVFATCGLLGAPAAEAFRPEGPLRINQIQVIGTHNSYHVEASPAEEALRSSLDPTGEQALEYDHPGLAQQFSDENIRQIELDVFADPRGGLYAHPLIRAQLGEGAYSPAMNRPGIKVLHLQDIDYRSSCLSFRRCLRAVEKWSDAHPAHVPITILVELVDQPLVIPGAPFPFTQPVKWDAGQLDGLDREIRGVFRSGDVITPDAVRGHYPTLEDAVLNHGWPTLARSRGKVMFLMDNAGDYRTAYLSGHPALRGRELFTNSVPGQPDAAFIKENDPTGSGLARIQNEVRAGYIVRTRADVDTAQARTGDTTMRDAALASGAQLVSTDYPVPRIAARFGTDYVAQLPGGVAARCNPVNASHRCSDAALEPTRR